MEFGIEQGAVGRVSLSVQIHSRETRHEYVTTATFVVCTGNPLDSMNHVKSKLMISGFSMIRTETINLKSKYACSKQKKQHPTCTSHLPIGGNFLPFHSISRTWTYSLDIFDILYCIDGVLIAA